MKSGFQNFINIALFFNWNTVEHIFVVIRIQNIIITCITRNASRRCFRKLPMIENESICLGKCKFGSVLPQNEIKFVCSIIRFYKGVFLDVVYKK
jgi:hypothetical protein